MTELAVYLAVALAVALSMLLFYLAGNGRDITWARRRNAKAEVTPHYIPAARDTGYDERGRPY